MSLDIPAVDLADVPARILFITGSPRRHSNSQWLIDRAIDGAKALGGVDIDTFQFVGKRISPCTGCVEYCEQRKECRYDDHFKVLADKWLRADGIVWAVPVYTFGPPSQVRSWMDRFGEIFFQNMRDKDMPLFRFAKPTGIMVQGSSRFGGQEITAQAMMEHVILMDCLPVSGDMPHSDQAVLGQVIDKQTPESNPPLLHAAYRMGVRVAEMTKLVKLGKLALASSLPDVYWYSKTDLGEISRPVEPHDQDAQGTDGQFVNMLSNEDVAIRVLGINGSPRSPRRSNSQVLLDAARAGAEGVGEVDFVEFSFAHKKIEPCRMCIQNCSKDEECVVHDDMQAFRSEWLGADGIAWSVPIYHMGPPSQVRAALDRMNELRFQTSHNRGQKQYPRLMKSVGAIVQGGSLYGGQEITQQFLLHHAMLLQCLPVTGNMPESYLGIGCQVDSRESLMKNEKCLIQAQSLGQRVSEMAKIVKAGMMLAQDSLPDEYFPSREKMGLIDRREIT